MSERVHWYLHAAPAEERERRSQDVMGVEVESVQLRPDDQSHEFGCGFDVFLNRLESQDGAYVEWDGSFLWRQASSVIEGNVFDGQQGIANVELKTSCDAEHFQALLKLLGWPDQEVLVQLVLAGVIVSVADALRLLSASQS